MNGLYLLKVEFPYIRMLCAKFGWNLSSGSWVEDFYISSKYFRYFLIMEWHGKWAFIWTNLNTLHIQGCFVPSFIEIGSVVLEKIFKFGQWIFYLFRYYLSLEIMVALYLNKLISLLPLYILVHGGYNNVSLQYF